jgi:nucleoside-diphosphate-sugar epimerase
LYSMTNKLFIIGKRSNLSCELNRLIAGSKLISGDDLHLLPDLLAAAGRSDVVFNLFYKSAWLGQRDKPEAYARYAFQRMAEFTKICRDYRHYIDRVIYTSSSAVYGNNTLASESDQCLITNLYSSLKFASELFLREHLADTSIRLVITRVFNMYGGDDEFSVVSKIAKAFAQGNEFTVANNGGAVRDFVHIQDVVVIYQRLLESQFDGIVNVGSGVGLSVSNLIEKAEAAFGRTLRLTHVERDEIAHSIACSDALIRAIGPKDFIPVDRFFLEQIATNS